MVISFFRNLSAEKRKGIGYVIEALAAMVTIFVFILGNSSTPQVQDWSQYQKKTTASDLGHTLKQTGDLDQMIKRREVGSLETSFEELGNLEVSGTISNIPVNQQNIGYHVIKDKRHEITPRDVASSDKCAGDLEEIENETGKIKRTDKERHDVILYIADTDPDISGGKGNLDYDSLWVDNGTACQFSASEGPFYIDQFFKWGNSTNPSDYEYYEFRNITENGDDFDFYNASQIIRIRETVNQRINGIRNRQNFDAFAYSQQDLTGYDTLVFPEGSLNKIDSDQEKLENFMRSGTVLFLANFVKSDLNSGFMAGTGFAWADLSDKPTGGDSGIDFSDTESSEMLETYFSGISGDRKNVDLNHDNVVSNSSGTIMSQNLLVKSSPLEYKTNDWNATNYTMDPVTPDQIDNNVVKEYPESECVDPDEASQNLTIGEFSFPGSEEFKVLNTEMGVSNKFCRNQEVRSLSIDLDGDGNFVEEGEGPFLNGEIINIVNRRYRVRRLTADTNRKKGEGAEFVFQGNSEIPIVKHRQSFQDFQGTKMALIPYEEDYSEDDRKIVAVTLYWLLGDEDSFGREEETSFSTEIPGSIKEETYMPYNLALRWK